METAVSIPDNIFRKTERLARPSNRSRSRVVSNALEEYLARRSPYEVTEVMDDVIAERADGNDPIVNVDGRSVLKQVV